VRPSPALEKLRAKHLHRIIEPGAALKLVTLDDFRAAASEVQLAFQAGTDGETGIRLTDGTKSLEARYDHRRREVQLDLTALSPAAKAKANAGTGGDGSRLSENRASIRRAPLPMKPGEPVTLRLFSDRSIFEIYANDELVISTAAFFHDPENLKARLFDRNGSKTQLTVDAWEMQPLAWSSAMKR
jgi:sucrose-6-phosphate hydrolase SacC (GH32 family)